MYTLWPQRPFSNICYDKINFLNFANKKNTWVPYKTNPHGPKRKWVPKSPPCVFDVGEGSHTTGEGWCLGSGCMDLMDTYLMHRYQGGLVGLPPYFGELEDSPYGLVTISKLLIYLHAYSYMIFLACSCFICFVLHVVNTCLDVDSIKTCVYTCTSSVFDSYIFALQCSFILTICTCIA